MGSNRRIGRLRERVGRYVLLLDSFSRAVRAVAPLAGGAVLLSVLFLSLCSLPAYLCLGGFFVTHLKVFDIFKCFLLGMDYRR